MRWNIWRLVTGLYVFAMENNVITSHAIRWSKVTLWLSLPQRVLYVSTAFRRYDYIADWRSHIQRLPQKALVKGILTSPRIGEILPIHINFLLSFVTNLASIVHVIFLSMPWPLDAILQFKTWAFDFLGINGRHHPTSFNDTQKYLACTKTGKTLPIYGHFLF